jgi:hypothetical protein
MYLKKFRIISRFPTQARRRVVWGPQPFQAEQSLQVQARQRRDPVHPVHPVRRDLVHLVHPVRQDPVHPVRQDPVHPVRQDLVHPVRQDPVHPVRQNPVHLSPQNIQMIQCRCVETQFILIPELPCCQ